MPPALRKRPEYHGSTLSVRARVGGFATQLAYAGAHCLAHLTAAVSLLLLLELVRGGGCVGMAGRCCLYCGWRDAAAVGSSSTSSAG